MTHNTLQYKGCQIGQNTLPCKAIYTREIDALCGSQPETITNYRNTNSKCNDQKWP